MAEHDETITNRPTEVRSELLANRRRRISWGGIIAGTIAALAVQLLLTLLGASIGLWAINPEAGEQGFQGLGIGAGIWALVSFIIALFVGGWIGGRMSDVSNRLDGLVEGFMVWGLVTVFTFMLLTTAIGGIIGGAAGLAGDVLTTAGEQVENPQELMQEYGQALRDQIDEMQENPEERQELEQQAASKGDDAASATAAASFSAFIALLLGAISAAIAGWLGGCSGKREVAHVTHTVRPKS